MNEWVLLVGVMAACFFGLMLLAAFALHLGRAVKAEGKAELKGNTFSIAVVVPEASKPRQTDAVVAEVIESPTGLALRRDGQRSGGRASRLRASSMPHPPARVPPQAQATARARRRS